MKFQTFIFNWRGQIKKTKEKLAQFKEINIEPIVINSDDENKEYGWYNIGEESYFTAQFLKAIELFEADILFHIQADASFDNWYALYQSAEKYYEKYKWGIYAPNVDYTWYEAGRVDLDMFKLGEDNLRVVSNTDCTCWMIHKDIIEEAKRREVDFAPYKMGWSFDIVYHALSFMMKRPVLRDYRFTIQHPPGTNYNKQQAEIEMHTLYQSLPDDIKEAFSYIKGDRFELAKYYRKNNV